MTDADIADTAARHARWQQARRILLIRLDNLGDVLMSTAAFAAVRASLPDAHVALLAAPSTQALMPHLPEIDEFIGFPAPWMKAGAATLDAPSGMARGEAEGALVERLRAGRFDAAIIFTVCTQTPMPAALICRMAGIPLSLAYVRERAYGLLSDELPDPDVIREGMRHEVQRQLDLVAHVGFRHANERLRFRLRDEDRHGVRAALAEAGLAPGQPYVVVHPGASAASRRYPPASYGAVADLLLAGESQGLPDDVAVVFCAGPGEQPLVDAARAVMKGRSLQLTGKRSLGELAALIADAQVLVANNSGPVHLAAAVGTPVVDLYALTNPQHTPWQVPARVLYHDVPCRFCQKSVCVQGHHDCLTRVEPREVAIAVHSLIGVPA